MSCKGEVLVIDDDPDLQDLVAMALGRAGYATATASSGEEGLERVRGGNFDLAVLDIMMPGMGGLAALREIKKIAPLVEVVILTAHGSLDTAVESMRLGAFDYLQKPFNIAALEAVAGKAVEKRRLGDVARAALAAGAPNGLMQVIADSALGLLGADEVLVLQGQEGSGLSLAAAAGLLEGTESGRRLVFCAGCLGLLGSPPGEPLAFMPDYDPRFAGLPGSAALAACLFIPLDGGGALCALRRAGGRPFGEAELRRARSFSPLLSVAVRNSELNGQLRAARVQLAGMQKMESLGMLTAQVSHDFNNLLAVITGSVQLLMENIKPGADRKLPEEVLRMSREANALVKQLLLFSRREDGPPAPADLNALLDEVKLIVGKIAGKETEVEYLQEAGLPAVRIKPEQFKQVLLNLAGNAKKAMPGAGKISVTTRRAGAGEAPPGLKGDSFAVLEVSDEGTGISPENLARIFEPFFTTRSAGQGTGLGLHIARSLARECGGEITAENRAGGGAVFRVFLPAAGA